MSELNNSITLDEILKQAKNIGKQNNDNVSAERFFIVLLDMINSASNGSTELFVAKTVLETYGVDISSALKTMISNFDSEKEPSFGDTLYMQRITYDAKKKALEEEKTELTADVLTLCILKSPPTAVKTIINNTGNSKIVAQETKAEQRPEHADSIEAMLKKYYENESAKGKQSDEHHASSIKEDELEEKKTPQEVKSEIASLVCDVKRIRTQLQELIYGQENAVNVFVTGYFQASMLSMLDKSRKRPRATFLFAGPPGVGKTFLAEQAAEALKLPFMRFDMSEYADKEANIEFCGADKVYKDAKAGNVTSFVAENPKCVLLFDEIEKAHLCVIHLFLQMLDAGRLRDNYTDKEVSFTDAIIILTTNAGKQLYEDSESGNFSSVSRKVIVKALQKDINPETKAPYFPGALCSRFASGNVVMFNHIGAHNLRSIAKKEIEKSARNLEDATGIKLIIDESVYTALLFSEGSSIDARTVRSRAESFFNDELYELLRLISSEKVKTNIDDVEEIKISVDLSHANDKIRELFNARSNARVLAFADKETVSICKSNASSINMVETQSLQNAIGIMKSEDIGFVLIDMKYGVDDDSSSNLNLEDVESPSRDFFKFIREQGNRTPVYLLERSGSALNEEEKISFMRQGVRGILQVPDGNNYFSSQMDIIAESLHQQESMIKLAKENKLISFETAQTVSEDGKKAEIRLFDFEMVVAVDSEDSKDVLNSVSKPNVRFDEILGAVDAKKELQYFVDYLKEPKKYLGTGVKAPKGVLLYGPPGTGKTMLAKAMACESGVTFIAAEGNQFLKKFVGEGSERVHQLFKTARKYAPSILFIDEIDAIAKERKGSATVGAGSEETLTAFLTEMDGFVNDPSKPVFVLAATNFDVESGREKSLDPALMRRFDRRVYIDLPTKEDRIKFLKMKASQNKALDISEAQIDNIAIRSTGMSLAQLDSAVELALRSAIREGSSKVTDSIFEEAFETFNSGEVKKWDESQLERVARHEAGHAFICWKSGETPSYLTIVARGDHGGYMQHGEQENKAIYTKEELFAKIRTSLGGRAAEIVYYGDEDGISTGASGDLASATGLAEQIICTYGMDENLGLAVINGSSMANGSISEQVRNSVNRILNEQMQEAVRIISENKEMMDLLVEELMSKNHLTGADIETILSKRKK
ncbi:MAG: AAA family ATPase [Eubacterium sp.]|nr:AAA family ATPase [Eubacterium sp.]